MAGSFAVLIPRPGWFYKGLALSIAAHALVLGFYCLVGERVKEAVYRIAFEPPLPQAFWKPPRSTTRVLEFRKRPIPREAYRRRQTRVTRTQVREVQELVAMRTAALLGNLDAARIAPASLRGRERMAVGTGFSRGDAGILTLSLPELSKVRVEGIKEIVEHVDLSLDMLDIEDMDTGQYQAMVIQDPNDRRTISGFLHLAQALTRSRPLYLSDSGQAAVGFQQTNYRNLDYLIKALHEYTGVKADYLEPIHLDDPRLMQVPWLLLPDDFFWVHGLTEREIEHFGRYLVAGGFTVVRAWYAEKMKTPLFDKFRRALKSQRLNEGADWRFVYLKPDHPIYHSFFDFDMAVRDNQKLTAQVGDMGLEIGERLVALFQGARIVTGTARVGTGNAQIAVDGRRHLQFTVNTVVFALTQEGGVTQQLMGRMSRRSRENRMSPQMVAE